MLKSPSLSIALALFTWIFPAAVGWAGDEGFVPILDKEHTDGWKQIGGGRVNVQDGVASTFFPKGAKPGGFWYQKRSFTDVVLKLEFSVDTATSNSGVYVRYQRPGGHSPETDG